MKLIPDWVSHLKGVVTWTTASFKDICDAIKLELLIQDPMLTRRVTLFGLSIDKGETVRDFITRVEQVSTVCYLEKGLKHEDVLILCILRAISSDVRAKVLQYFTRQDPTIAAFKVYANNLIASEHIISGEVKAIKGGPGPKSKLFVKCGKCGRPGHADAYCRVRMCNYCKKPGHLENTCYSNPASPSVPSVPLRVNLWGGKFY